MASIVSLRFTHSFEPRYVADAKTAVLALNSIALPAAYEVPERALVGLAGRTISPVEAPARARSRAITFTIPVNVSVNRVPGDRIGWAQLTDPEAEPFEYLPLARLRNDALEPLLRKIVPEGMPLEGSALRLLHRHAVRLNGLVDAVREISPWTRVITLNAGESRDRLTLGILLTSEGAEIEQRAGYPFVFRFPKWLPKRLKR